MTTARTPIAGPLSTHVLVHIKTPLSVLYCFIRSPRTNKCPRLLGNAIARFRFCSAPQLKSPFIARNLLHLNCSISPVRILLGSLQTYRANTFQIRTLINEILNVIQIKGYILKRYNHCTNRIQLTISFFINILFGIVYRLFRIDGGMLSLVH